MKLEAVSVCEKDLEALWIDKESANKAYRDESEIEQLRAKLAKCEADAARYRWLRGRYSLIDYDSWPNGWQQEDGIGERQLDAAIDDAMKEAK